MRSIERARYEAGLAQIARGARQCANVLDGAGAQDAVWEFQALAVWAAGELDNSIANKRPLRRHRARFKLQVADED